jgi:YebC/PmpR family DNA-binding regulatory protein
LSGHSKWASIKHKKGATDAKRGQLFTKLARQITVAARQGGADPEMNPGLRLAIQRAKDSNLPNANIDRAIQKATGGGDTENLEEITYEGFGPGGMSVIVDVVTDNRNRTVADIRLAFSRCGGSLAENGAVGWQFEHRGLIAVSAQGADPDEIQLTAIEAGALDVDTSEDLEVVEITTEPGTMEAVRQALTEAGFSIEKAEIGRVAQNTIDLDAQTAESAIRLLERLDDLDDVTRVSTNAEFPDEVLAAVSG